MTVYFILYILIGSLPLVFSQSNTTSSKKNKYYITFSFIFLFLLFALRHPSMGNDLRYESSTGYLAAFKKISSLSWKALFLSEGYQNYEWGYIIFNKIIGSIFPNPQIFLAICAFISLFPIAYVLYKKSCDPIFSCFIFLGLPPFLMLYSGLRQSIAIGLCFLSILFIQDKKPIKFIITIFIAWLFHSSSFIFLLAYPIYYMKINFNGRILSLLFLPVIFIFRVPLFSILSRIFKENAMPDDNGAFILLIVLCLVYFFCFFFSKNSTKNNGYLNLLYLACACQVFGNVYQLAMRVGYYFMIFLILLLPDVVNEMKDSQSKTIAKFFILAAFITFGLYSIYNASWANSYPYSWFWT